MIERKDPHVQKVLQEKAKFEIGDVVRLVSGGPSMTVRNIESDELVCEWFDKASIRSHTFLKSQLIHTTPQQHPIINIDFRNPDEEKLEG